MRYNVLSSLSFEISWIYFEEYLSYLKILQLHFLLNHQQSQTNFKCLNESQKWIESLILI